ncbi:TetR family transcriptional regulator [Planctomonas sp. JC2975]|uniref:TetR family transcriptional regulator n=1 Tax=Planctomonas sp. JC2975 TaxID=2729626 RepID=UPI0014733FEB|nr:TetR family transcriptional regulator [Planctomonas sp. JC2975]
MSDLSEGAARTASAETHRRADAVRSRSSILESAARRLALDPTAGVEQIAAAAGVTRQTVYAHFGTRDRLIEKTLDDATERMIALFDRAALEQLPAPEALVALVHIAFTSRDPFAQFLFAMGSDPSRAGDRRRHEPVFDRLDIIVRRGQADGSLDPSLPAVWIRSATVALAHATAEAVAARAIPRARAETALTDGLKRLFRP